MKMDSVSRRSFLQHLGVAGAGAMAYSAHSVRGLSIAKPESGTATAQISSPQSKAAQSKAAASRAQRMAWWHEAKFGMFIHWGLYSVIGQHEWAMEVEGIPVPQYELLAKHFQAQAATPRASGRSWPNAPARNTW